MARRPSPAAPASALAGDCRDRLEKLFTYIDEDLRGPARTRLEQHLETCHCCGELERSLRRTVFACREAGRRKLPADVRQRAKQRIAALLKDM